MKREQGNRGLSPITAPKTTYRFAESGQLHDEAAGLTAGLHVSNDRKRAP
jgi:hypothetical protein